MYKPNNRNECNHNNGEFNLINIIKRVIDIKKIIYLIVFLILTALLVSCNQNGKDRNINEKLIETAKSIEVLDHKFSNFYLTYDEYIDEMNKLDISIDEESHLDRVYVPEPIDLSTIEKSELDIAKDEQEQNVNVEISEVYDYENLKYIFTKSTVTPEEDIDIDKGIIITRRYTFINVSGNWTTSSIGMRIYEYGSEEKDMEFNKFDNETVEYKYSLNPLI